MKKMVYGECSLRVREVKIVSLSEEMASVEGGGIA